MVGTVFLRKAEQSVSETDGVVYVEIDRTGSLSGDVTIMYGIVGAGATEGQDYLGTGGTIIMPDGASSVTVPITIVNDLLGEPTEVFTLSLISASGGLLVAPRTDRISILDDEIVAPPPQEEPPLVSPYVVQKDSIITGLDTPVRFTFSPVDPNLVYIAEKGGAIKLANLTTGEVDTVLDLSAQVNSAVDRGLLDVALHPDFINNPYIYAFYVVDPPETAGNTGNAGQDGDGNRFSYLVRYTADAADNYHSIVAGSGVILLGGAGQSLDDISGGGVLDFTDPAYANNVASDHIAQPGDLVINGIKQDYLKGDSLSHSGGRLLFGPDGMLYVATGDGGSYNYADPHNEDVQNLDTLSGKVLRIDPITGEGLADNPFALDAVSLDANRAKIFQYGLRNPFSAAFDASGKLLISDVGWFSYEEINSAGPGANFGWPFYEGGNGNVSLPTYGFQFYPEALAFYAAVAAGTISVTAPFESFSHFSGAPGFQLQAITSSGIVLPGTVYPESMLGDFVFTDFVGGDVYTVKTDDSTALSYLFDWGNSFGPVHMIQGPDGYLYYADLFNGVIGRLLITDAPHITVPDTADVTEDFSVTASGNVLANDTDAEGDPLSIRSAEGLLMAAGGSLTLLGHYGTLLLHADGTYTYTLANADTEVQALNSGETLTEIFHYRVSDGQRTLSRPVRPPPT